MTDNNQNTAENSNEPFFNIQRVYLKDCSIEQPNSPQIFLEQNTPDIEIQLDVSATRLQDTVFEVVVKSVLTIKQQDKAALLIELQQAGIFEIKNVEDSQLDPILGIACPTIIYPYLRSNMADLIARSGFAPIHLSEINFQVLYEQRLQRLQQEQAQQA
ncbi:MAG: preprotein translocase SecB subunit [Pseudomonadota bacterium]|jgi:preprotein translocase subunit SecB